MNNEKIEQKIIELGLELYLEKKGKEAYDRVIILLDENPAQADLILEQFFNENREELINRVNQNAGSRLQENQGTV